MENELQRIPACALEFNCERDCCQQGRLKRWLWTLVAMRNEIPHELMTIIAYWSVFVDTINREQKEMEFWERVKRGYLTTSLELAGEFFERHFSCFKVLAATVTFIKGLSREVLHCLYDSQVDFGGTRSGIRGVWLHEKIPMDAILRHYTALIFREQIQLRVAIGVEREIVVSRTGQHKTFRIPLSTRVLLAIRVWWEGWREEWYLFIDGASTQPRPNNVADLRKLLAEAGLSELLH
jgi:hypothetical protein